VQPHGVEEAGEVIGSVEMKDRVGRDCDAVEPPAEVEVAHVELHELNGCAALRRCRPCPLKHCPRKIAADHGGACQGHRHREPPTSARKVQHVTAALQRLLDVRALHCRSGGMHEVVEVRTLIEDVTHRTRL
jgi:hypothetical protein